MYMFSPEELRSFHNERVQNLIGEEHVSTHEKVLQKARAWKIKWQNRDERA